MSLDVFDVIEPKRRYVLSAGYCTCLLNCGKLRPTAYDSYLILSYDLR